jgi:hypothetical protein
MSLSEADLKEIDSIFAMNGAVTMLDTWLETYLNGRNDLG